MLKSTLYFIFLFRAADFRKKEIGQHIFFVGGHWVNQLSPSPISDPILGTLDLTAPRKKGPVSDRTKSCTEDGGEGAV